MTSPTLNGPKCRKLMLTDFNSERQNWLDSVAQLRFELSLRPMADQWPKSHSLRLAAMRLTAYSTKHLAKKCR